MLNMKKILLLIIILILAVVGIRRFTAKNSPELNQLQSTIDQTVDESKPEDFSAEEFGGQTGDEAANNQISKELETLEKELNMLDDSVFDSAGL